MTPESKILKLVWWIPPDFRFEQPFMVNQAILTQGTPGWRIFQRDHRDHRDHRREGKIGGIQIWFKIYSFVIECHQLVLSCIIHQYPPFICYLYHLFKSGRWWITHRWIKSRWINRWIIQMKDVHLWLFMEQLSEIQKSYQLRGGSAANQAGLPLIRRTTAWITFK